MERKKSEQRFLVKADVLDDQATEAEMWKTKFECNERQLEREAQMTGLNTEIQVLEEDFPSATGLQNNDDVHLDPLLHWANDKVDKTPTCNTNTTRQQVPTKQANSNRTDITSDKTFSNDVVVGTPSPRMESHGYQQTEEARNPVGTQVIGP